MAANAQGFGNNININLNDVMVGQRMQDMQQRLNNANVDAMFVAKKHHQKQDKKNKHRMALLQNNDDAANSNNNVGTVSAVNQVTDAAAQPASSVNIQQ